VVLNAHHVAPGAGCSGERDHTIGNRTDRRSRTREEVDAVVEASTARAVPTGDRSAGERPLDGAVRVVRVGTHNRGDPHLAGRWWRRLLDGVPVTGDALCRSNGRLNGDRLLLDHGRGCGLIDVRALECVSRK